MESPAVGVLPAKRPANGFNLEKHKRLKVVDYSNPYAIADLLDGLNHGKFGSVTKDIESLIAQKMQTLSPIFAKDPALLQFVKVGMNHNEDTAKKIIDLEDNLKTKTAPKASSTVVIIDSDEEDDRDKKPFLPFQEVVLPKPVVPPTTKDMVVYHGPNAHPSIGCHAGILGVKPELSLVGEDNIEKDKGAFIGVQGEDNPQADTKGDELDDIWREMSMAIECSKDDAMDSPHDEAEKGGGDCDHSYVLKDDLGYVCRVCGVIDRGIETIFEFQYKVKKSTRTYAADSWNAKERTAPEVSGLKFGEDGLVITEISAHPRHMKQMKPHQIEGFNFLVRNLAGDNPGGCILAHAPGSGKTFMIISFMQSFLGKYPQAHPLVVLPKGILATWKKEFQTWQVEDIPLYDFYSAKADSRSQQLEVLKQWVEQKSILFLGYKQFSSIVCDTGTSPVSVTCQKILLEAPSILILDEGHTPRNDNTDIVQSLTKVQTPRKVVLSGTLYQNHVKEVFNILNIVRPPNFLRSQTSRPIVRRIKSRVHVPGVKDFCDLVENTLQKDPDFKRKVAVIQDLREMTSQVLHYYKGDFLDELPGLVDFAVVLNLTPRQKHEVHKLKHLSRKFKISSVGSAVYLHAKLKPMAENCAENSAVSDQMMDEKIESIDVEDGVKSKFFLKMLNLCESSGEKLLVFSQYLLPLKYLERLTVKRKGWSPGKEIFVISGESSSEQREWSMERFNNSPDAKVFFGSIKACGEGISLVGASRIIILDVHLNPSVTRQAIGRAFRPGQTKKVFAYRLIAADSPEQEDHDTCFKKELISKMWFEWNEYCGFRDFEVETVNVEQCDDFFLQSPLLRDDIKILHRRP
ncbi:protein CHROMATIN REMODELING 35-like isoform X1 [Neltuma alba]|uniref:protein CHROMATIN REMODELING 35-like isoform X1 n=1 Tax=Neltuma alba TaxID=207710 RepID=UPI0010A33ED8|nr:protein CHROMATIN REMODELING 35-like isoform X1 [Prosopis alba]XP_028765719.1 protein CHROMATIN REMODELING 35-like isoform X1 [Prosopis alba]XP_028765720.1 protein CHROMATIN REMODELING 35-like isoform X1 [Prosopis alba]XP_028768080.1 protein CHROMATIN REMODELING 35-like isoform X1 [Prosopis alba]XP_028768089.1 protein CHROMATIN REMODELING 35-like isoform X1 [Prosopis alba]XP_028768098.1 protein CHROMATIN REMODELING 35-like isoform X1 [Prosopis alba]XP_028768106.1 protein CHROMATIN REMODELI